MPWVCVCLYCRLQRRRLARAQPDVRSRRFPSTANSSARGRRSSTQTADCCCSAHDLPTTIDSWHCLAGTHCLPTWLACLRSGHSPLDADRCSLTSGCAALLQVQGKGSHQGAACAPCIACGFQRTDGLQTERWHEASWVWRADGCGGGGVRWGWRRRQGVCLHSAQHACTHIRRLARTRRRETIQPSCVVHSLPATAVFSVLPVALSANSHVNCCCCVVIHAHVTTERQSASNGHSAERTTEQITAATWRRQEIHRALALLTGSATCYLPGSGSGGVCNLCTTSIALPATYSYNVCTCAGAEMHCCVFVRLHSLCSLHYEYVLDLGLASARSCCSVLRVSSTRPS